MKLLITGITGFVGLNLAKYLEEEYEIQGVSRKKTSSLISYNDLNEEALNISKAFIHLAGKAHDLKKTSEDKEYFEVNTELTKTLFDKFLESTCEVFIYMSSVKAVADSIKGKLTEEVVPNPITVYGKSKLAAEQYILSKELPKNKKVYILRPCMIHGPGNKGNLNLLYTFVSKGIPYPFGRYENQRSFLSIENLSFVIRELVENKNIPSGVYNVADDDSLSTKELVKSIAKVIDKKTKILNFPKFLVNILAKIGDVLPLPINSEKVQKLTENYVVANDKIKVAIQKELPLRTVQGINNTIKSFKNK